MTNLLHWKFMQRLGLLLFLLDKGKKVKDNTLLNFEWGQIRHLWPALLWSSSKSCDG